MPRPAASAVISRSRISAALASLALGLALTAPGASALTQNQKNEAFWACKNAGGSNKACCHLVGGQYEVDFDEHGNIVAERCFVSADPLVGQTAGASSAGPVGANPGTGATSSGLASNGATYTGTHSVVAP